MKCTESLYRLFTAYTFFFINPRTPVQQIEGLVEENWIAYQSISVKEKRKAKLGGGECMKNRLSTCIQVKGSPKCKIELWV